MPKDLILRYPIYEDGESYAKGKRVRVNDKCYESKHDNNTSPYYEVEDWMEYDILEDYLKGLTENGIKKVLTRFIGEKVTNKESHNLVDRRVLFDGVGRKEGRNLNSGRLVGFEFNPIRANGITATLNKVGLQFIGNVGVVKLYLFHSSQSEPIATIELDYTSERGSFMWFDLEDWVMPYVDENINAGGSWYVVYDEASLPDYMQSINFGKDWSREPCGTCNKGDINLYRLLNKYITISPFYVAKGDWDETLWDVNDNMYTYGNNYGLNFMVSMACDITDAILAESFNFATAIQLQVATEALRALALNPEVSVNRVQFNAERDGILFELSGNGQGIKGLQGELDRAFKVLSIDTKGLDPICLGCHNQGVHYRSI